MQKRFVHETADQYHAFNVALTYIYALVMFLNRVFRQERFL